MRRRALLAKIAGTAVLVPIAARAQHDKVQFLSRLHELEGQYAHIKAGRDRYRPMKPYDPPELRKARTELEATMRSYEQLEAEAQAQRGKLAAPGSSGDMSETEQMRLQMNMDQMSKLLETMSNLMKTISATGDSIIQNMK